MNHLFSNICKPLKRVWCSDISYVPTWHITLELESEWRNISMHFHLYQYLFMITSNYFDLCICFLMAGSLETTCIFNSSTPKGFTATQFNIIYFITLKFLSLHWLNRISQLYYIKNQEKYFLFYKVFFSLSRRYADLAVLGSKNRQKAM